MAGTPIQLPTLVQKYRLDTASGVQAANTSLNRFQSNATRRMARTGALMSKGLTLPIVGAFAVVAGVGTKALIEVEEGLREVNSLFGETGEAGERNFRELQTMVKDLSQELGVAQSTITDGLYQAISAGVPKDNAFEFMQVATKASIAGITDVETSVDGLTSIINAWGLEASDAQAVADSMFATVQGGKTTFEELSASIFQVAPAAAAAKVDFQEVNAAIATMTAQGVPTAEATTRIAAALRGLQRPSKELDEIFQAQGYANAQLALENEGLVWSLEQVAKATDGDTGALQKLLGRSEAVQAVQILAGTGAGKFADELDRQANSAGAADSAFQELEKSNARKLERLKVTFENLAMVLAEQLLPVVTAFAEKATALLLWFSELDSGTKKAIGGVTAFVAALGPVLLISAKFIEAWRLVKTALAASKVFGPVVKGVKALTVAFKAFGASLLTNPVFLVIAALVLLGIALFTLYKKNETFRKLIDAAWQKIQQIWDTAFEFIRGVISSAVEWIQSTWSRIVEILDGPVQIIMEILTTAFEVIRTIVTTAFQVLVEIFQTSWNLISGVIRTAVGIIMAVLRPLIAIFDVTIGNAIRLLWGIVQAVWPLIWQAIQTYVGLIVSWIRTNLTILRTIWNAAWEVIKAVIDFIWPIIRDRIMTAISTIRTVIETAISVIKSVWSAGWGFVRDRVIPIFQTILDKVRTFKDGVVGAIRGAVDLVGRAWNGLKSVFAGVVNWVIRNVINRFIGAVQRVAGALGVDVNLSKLDEISTGGSGYQRPDGRHAGGVVGQGGRGTRKGKIGGLHSDEEMIVAQKGEGIIPRSAMASLGASGFQSILNGGRVPFTDAPIDLGDRIGGWGSLNPVNAVKGAVEAAGDAVGAVIREARKVIANFARPAVEAALRALDSIPFGGGFKDYVVGAARKMGDWVLDWIAGVDEEGEKHLAPEVGPGVGWQKLWSIISTRFPGAWKSSDLRPGDDGYHGVGRAIDFGYGASPGPGTLQVARWVADQYPHSTELIHTPLGFGIKNGARVAPYAAADHYDHIHWAMGNGGLAVGPATALIGETYRSRPEHVTPDRLLRQSIREEVAGVVMGQGGMSPAIGTQNVYGVMPGDVQRETKKALETAARKWHR